MTIAPDEALACLKLLVCVAKADNEVLLKEYDALRDALEDVNLPRSVTAGSILGDTYDADGLIREIQTKEARDAAYDACYAMAHADGVYHEQEEEILAKLEDAWEVSRDKKNIFGRIFQEARDTVSFRSISPISDPEERRKEIDEDVLKYSILAAALGMNPVPLAKIATEMAVVGVQGKVAYDVGRYWGHATTSDGAKRLVSGMCAGTAGRVAINSLLGFVPVLGSTIPAVTNFSATWAVGRVSNQYFANGGKLDVKTLRDSFKREKKDGKSVFERNKVKVQKASEQKSGELARLGADLQTGKITRKAYEERVLDLG